MSKTTAEDYLSQSALLRLLAVLLLVIGPHLTRLPLWASLFTATLLLWRGAVSLRGWRLPARWLRMALTLTAFVGIYASYGRASGLSAGSALLTVMLALKLTEMQARRDVMVVVILSYFVLITHFLFSQDLWTIGYLGVAAVAITAVMVEANHAGRALPARVSLRLGALLVAQAVPLMLLLFVLFPRIPGPLWGLPLDGGGGRSGLSDSMSPGDISSLIQSDELAFRVTFDGAPPPPRERYWRGPTFELFDGRGWSSAPRFIGRAYAELRGQPRSYEVIAEPHDRRWLFALDIPDPSTMPAEAFLNADLEMTARAPVRKRFAYRITSYTDFRFEPDPPEAYLRTQLQLPRNGNPRSRAWAEELRTQHNGDGAAISDAVNAHFRNTEFFYTLEPPTLARDSIDDFLFNIRRGFCEHYASSYVYLMRAAGIPSRVVTGYLGGELNEFGGHFTVRQSDAHAWAEIWLPERGWTRVDPTGAVAPSRVEQGLSSAISLANGLPSFLANRSGLNLAWRARWDWVNAGWNSWVLAYGPELQQEFLSKLGLIDWQRMIIALTVLVTLALSILGLSLMRQAAVIVRNDPALRLWHAAQRKLARAGIATRPSEGPQDFASRIARQHPELRDAMESLAALYLQTRYLGEADPDLLKKMAEEIQQLKPARTAA